MRLSTKCFFPTFGRTGLHFPLLVETFLNLEKTGFFSEQTRKKKKVSWEIQEFWEFIYCPMDWNHSSTYRFLTEILAEASSVWWFVHVFSIALAHVWVTAWQSWLGKWSLRVRGGKLVIFPLDHSLPGCCMAAHELYQHMQGKSGAGRSRKMRAAQTAAK